MLALATSMLVGCSGAGGGLVPEPAPLPIRPEVVAEQPAAAVAALKTGVVTASTGPVILKGTGQLVALPREEQIPSLVEGDGYQLNFTETDIATIVGSILGEALGLRYVIDPNVKGTMTLQTSSALSGEEILPALEAALRVHGASLVIVNGIYQVVPIRDAIRRVTKFRGPGALGGPGYSIQIVPLRFISVVEMEKALRPFAPDEGIVRVDEGRNLLLLAGTGQELETMLDLVDIFDVDWLSGMSFALFPLDYVEPTTLADELGEIFSKRGSPIADIVHFVPLARLNALMVVTPQPDYLTAIEQWIQRLDVGVSMPGRQIYVYEVQNGRASALAESLNKILSLSGQELDSVAVTSVTPEQPTGSMQPVDPVRRESVSLPEATAFDQGALRIVPNEESNSLLILGSPAEYLTIETALKKLDVVPLQVLIEASLAEVALTDDLRYGIQWSYESGEGPIILSEADSGGVLQSFPGFSYLYTGRESIRAVLNTLESITDVNVISSPKLLVLNNHEAQLQVGDQVPVAVQSSVSTDTSGAPIVNAVEMRDTGVILYVTPRVNKSGLALLDITQEVSDVVATTTSTINSPTIQQRKLSSTVAVRDGETIALGGLIRETGSTSQEGLPLLRRIPLLGNLFGSTATNRRRTELIVLITPRVLRSAHEAAIAMKELREKFRAIGESEALWNERQLSKEIYLELTDEQKDSPLPPAVERNRTDTSE